MAQKLLYNWADVNVATIVEKRLTRSLHSVRKVSMGRITLNIPIVGDNQYYMEHSFEEWEALGFSFFNNEPDSPIVVEASFVPACKAVSKEKLTAWLKERRANADSHTEDCAFRDTERAIESGEFDIVVEEGK